MKQFISGGLALGFWAAGLFFLRFFSRTRDPLFGFFTAAFWLMALGRLILSLFDVPNEARVYLYGLRLLAFVLIIVAIIIKNHSGRSTGVPPPDPERESHLSTVVPDNRGP